MSNPSWRASNAVQVGDFVYVFGSAKEAKAFYDCVIDNNVEYCEPKFSCTKTPLAQYEAPGDDNDDDDEYEGEADHRPKFRP